MDNLCNEIWLHLNQTNLQPLPKHLVSACANLTFDSVLQSFTGNTSVKTMNLRALSEADEVYLASQQISSLHLTRSLEKTLKGRHFDPLAFQLNAVRRKAIYAFCPFSGNLVESNQSLLANITVVFYRFETKQIFYVVTAGIGCGFAKSAIYLPQQELVITVGDDWGFEQSDLMELKARMVSNPEACYAYLSDRAAKQTAVCLGFYHFAHHLWNELSGVQRLYQKRLLHRVNKFLMLREPLGPLEQIFPEIPANKVERSNSTGDLFLHILANRYFVIKAGGDYLAATLIDRIARVSLANCSPAVVAQVKQARAQHHPLLWVGIRVGNRSWVDQAEGISNIIAALYKEFPKLGVVFDGFSLPADRSAKSSDQQGYTGILAQENAVVDAVRERLQERQLSPGIFNVIGGSILDANVWAHAIDIYVSPYGSIQHKVGWFANKPGVVHSNPKLLENPAPYIWSAIENGIPPRYVSLSAVSEVVPKAHERMAYNEIKDASESGAGILALNKKTRENPEFDNYRVQWEALHGELLNLIRTPKRKFALKPHILANRAKRKLRKAVRVLSTGFRRRNLV